MTQHDRAWEAMPDEESHAHWTEFIARHGFRPGVRPEDWPALDEPVPSVTYDLTPLFEAVEPESTAVLDRLERLVLAALTEAFPVGERLAVLDWQHTGHWFRPQLASDAPWPVPAFPNGDYHLFLTEDMTDGLLGHPWERTLCVFGPRLTATLVPRLSWLPVTRSRQPGGPGRAQPSDSADGR
ncbi:DUF2716 domain-containing protein [Streptomyces sviceus]|uniref:DUF2716 domain-containing protein n=1 Tax=Streptomyces sviceus TaxID=285530 RepID=UPI003318FA1F